MSISPVQDVVTSAAPARLSQATGNAPQATPVGGDSVAVSSGNGSAYNLRTASIGLAQLGSLLQVASSGTQQIDAILTQLQQLAQQVLSGDSAQSSSADLNSQFQQLLSGVDEVSAGTSFDGTNLLDGSLGSSGVNPALAAAIEASGQDSTDFTPVIPSLTAQSLFGNNLPGIATPADAQSAYNAIASAQGVVADASGSIDEAQSQASFASANIDAAIANSDASASTLDESDFGDGLTIFDGVQSTPDTSASAQTGNLSSSLLALLNE